MIGKPKKLFQGGHVTCVGEERNVYVTGFWKTGKEMEGQHEYVPLGNWVWGGVVTETGLELCSLEEMWY